ncbi:hypothetical protein ACIO8H_31430 [Streptomyces sp. NPDC087226]|uniref:hypothetical protein n=1 Tax=Streptomyces sp. NPDC087226 TaxID=3365771 RepID=UPI0038289B44
MTPRDPRTEVRRLLYELCVELGFCLPDHERRRLEDAPPPDADRFTDAVFAAEGMDPGPHTRLRQQVRDTVSRHMSGWAGPLDEAP